IYVRRFLCLNRIVKYYLKARLKRDFATVLILRSMISSKMRETVFRCLLKWEAVTAGIVTRLKRGSGNKVKSAGSVPHESGANRRGLLPKGASLFYCLLPETVT